MNHTPESKEIALSPKAQHLPEVYIPSQTDWNFMVQWGQQAIKTGMLPSAVKNGESAAIIILKGRELGLSFMTSIAHIHVISGKPTMSAELIQGLARKNLPGLVINILESDDKIAKIEFIRPEKGSKPYVQSFAIADAERAKLMQKDVWKQYPASMLWSRAVTAGLRKICPEALMGISYTPEEMGANVDNEGNVIEITGKQVPDSTPPPPANPQSQPKPAPVIIKPKEQNPHGMIHPPDSDADTIAKKGEGFKVKGLKGELGLTDEQLREELYREFKTEEWKTLTLAQMQQFTRILESHKAATPGSYEMQSEPEPQDSFNNFDNPL